MQDLPDSYDAWLTTDPRMELDTAYEAFAETPAYAAARERYMDDFDYSTEFDSAFEDWHDELGLDV